MGTVYEYDLAGRINGITSRDRDTNKMQAYESIRYNEGKGTVKSKIYNIYGADGQLLRQTPYSFTYGDPAKGEIPDTLYKLETGGGSYSYAYDSLARLESRTLTLGDTVKTESYTYAANPANSAFTTPLVSSMTDLAGKTHTYTYDANGNILTDTVDGQTVQYAYDSFNRLTGYYDPIANRTEFYTYDDRGNITERKYRNSYVSPEEVAENGTSGFTVTPYEYGDGTWADLLTKYGSTAIAYDEIGNPLNGKASNMTYTWDKGRNLVQYNFRSYSTSYTYNVDGLRTSKTYYQSSSISKSTEYFIVDGRYVGEISTVGSTDYVIAYVYDENGSPAGINVNGTQYWFAKNLQGDVTAILDSTGAVVAVYTYSAWGVKVSVKDAAGNRIDLKSHVAHLNPFRYRGYMYDEETGYYYLRSRYYNPEMGRFLNADGYVSTGVGLDGYNMFAYCNNNPIMLTDSNGDSPCPGTRAHIRACNAGLEHCDIYHDGKSAHRALLAELGRPVYPVENPTDISSTYDDHNAIDFHASKGSEIYAMWGGVVEEVVKTYDNSYMTDTQGTESWGNYIKIRGSDGTCYYYAHMQQDIIWDVGDTIAGGQLLGHVGSTGRTYRVENGEPVLGYAHLHFEIRVNGRKISQEMYKQYWPYM